MTRAIPSDPPELIVLDEEEDCPYLEGRIARRPLRIPVRALSEAELDLRLHAGDRRSGPFLYNQRCRDCSACEALRIDVTEFVPSRTQKRVLRRATAELSLELGAPEVSAEKVELFSKHEEQRGLRQRDRALDEDEYARFLVQSCVPSLEMRYRLRATGELVGVAIVDRGRESLSAVYTFYDPAHSKLSLGTYSILMQIELCRKQRLRWLYLGLAIEGNPHMRYKLDWLPHERRIGGEWRRFARTPLPDT